MSDFPQGGSNFTVVGAWGLSQGSAWHHWQCEALRAQIRAAEAAGEAFSARRFRAALERLIAAGPEPVRRTPGASTG